MVVRVAEILLREDLSFVLQALSRVIASGDLGSDLTCLNFLTLVLLRYDILLDTFFDPFSILTFHPPLMSFNGAVGDLLRNVSFLAYGVPILHSS